MSVSFPEKIYEYFYRRRKQEAESRQVKFDNVRIVSVGNLTTGGTGKTPCVQWIARRLQREGLKTVVIGRGYGGEYSRQKNASGAIVSDGAQFFLDAKQAGDEAILHARSLKEIPVLIGRDRVAAVKTAIEKFAPNVIVLDDGFQYWSLARDFDLVLLDSKKPFGNGKLLPLGRLREPMEELQRADGVLLTRADAASESELSQTRARIKELTIAPIFQATHAPVYLLDESSGARLELGVLASRRVAAVGALADNENFFASLKNLGAEVVSTLARRDHHQWRENEIREFSQRAQEQGATAIITTEKDAVKMDAAWAQPLPIYSVGIEMRIENESALWDLVRAKIFSL